MLMFSADSSLSCGTTSTFAVQEAPEGSRNISSQRKAAESSELDPDWIHVRQIYCVKRNKSAIFFDQSSSNIEVRCFSMYYLATYH